MNKYLYLGHFLLKVSDEDFTTYYTSKYNSIGATKEEWAKIKNKALKLNILR